MQWSVFGLQATPAWKDSLRTAEGCLVPGLSFTRGSGLEQWCANICLTSIASRNQCLPCSLSSSTPPYRQTVGWVWCDIWHGQEARASPPPLARAAPERETCIAKRAACRCFQPVGKSKEALLTHQNPIGCAWQAPSPWDPLLKGSQVATL